MEDKEAVVDNNVESTESGETVSESGNGTATSSVVNVYVDDVRLNTEQYDTLTACIEDVSMQTMKVTESVSHMSVMISFLCMFEAYRMLCRIRKKWGVK